MGQVDNILIEFPLSETNVSCQLQTWTACMTDGDANHYAIYPPPKKPYSHIWYKFDYTLLVNFIANDVSLFVRVRRKVETGLQRLGRVKMYIPKTSPNYVSYYLVHSSAPSGR